MLAASARVGRPFYRVSIVVLALSIVRPIDGPHVGGGDRAAVPGLERARPGASASKTYGYRPNVVVPASPTYNWPELHANPQLTGYSPNSTLTTANASSLGVGWSVDLYGSSLDTPAVAYDSISGRDLCVRRYGDREFPRHQRWDRAYPLEHLARVDYPELPTGLERLGLRGDLHQPRSRTAQREHGGRSGASGCTHADRGDADARHPPRRRADHIRALAG